MDLEKPISGLPDQPLGSVPSPVTVLDQQSFEIGPPKIARINDALLGGTYDQLVEDLGPDFPGGYAPVLRSVLFVLERHEAKLVTAMTIIAGGAR